MLLHRLKQPFFASQLLCLGSMAMSLHYAARIQVQAPARSIVAPNTGVAPTDIRDRLTPSGPDER